MKEITVAGTSSAPRDESPVVGYTKASALPKKGITIKATYLGYFTGGKYNSTTHYLKLVEGNLNVLSNDEIVKAGAGDKVGLSGTKMLNALLEQVDRNSNIELIFSGMKEFTTKAGELAREAQFQLFAAESETAVATDDKAAVDIF